jgi:hypothetical protein
VIQWFGSLDIHDAVGTHRALADERNGTVDGHAIKPGIGELFFFQARQPAPDLEQDFLIQIVLVGCIPGVNAADLENSVSILMHQFQEPVFVCRRRIQFRTFI